LKAISFRNPLEYEVSECFSNFMHTSKADLLSRAVDMQTYLCSTEEIQICLKNLKIDAGNFFLRIHCLATLFIYLLSFSSLIKLVLGG
jgi:hypothetical protein